MHSTFLRGFADEVVKLASAGETVKRKAKGAAKGAVIGAGTAIGLPTALTLLLARGSRGLPRARDVASLMVGRLPRHMEELRDLEKITRRITGASALTGAGVGALTS